jgi:hypothetical protein
VLVHRTILCAEPDVLSCLLLQATGSLSMLLTSLV